jgi:predicted glycosyltransferase involved in capsule biosynthesis
VREGGFNVIAIVVTAYKLVRDLVDAFVENNYAVMSSFGACMVVVTDERDLIETENVHRVQAPEMEIFSICKCANLGIQKAIDLGADKIVKTDIDCVLSHGVMQSISEVQTGVGLIFRYWQIPSAGERGRAVIDPRIIGTCAMCASDWKKTGLYNERMLGYGYDDADIRCRMNAAGVRARTMKHPKLYHVAHLEKHNRATINPVMRQENILIGKKLNYRPA